MTDLSSPLRRACEVCAAALDREDYASKLHSAAQRVLNDFGDEHEAAAVEAVYLLSELVAPERATADPVWFAACLQLLLELASPSGRLGPEGFGLLGKLRAGVDELVARGPVPLPRVPSNTQPLPATPASDPAPAPVQPLPDFVSSWRATDVDGEWHSPEHALILKQRLPNIPIHGHYPRFKLVEGSSGSQYRAVLRWGHAKAVATILSEPCVDPDTALAEVIEQASTVAIEDVRARDIVREHFDARNRPLTFDFENINKIGIPRLVCRAMFPPRESPRLCSSLPMPTQRAAFDCMVRIAREQGLSSMSPEQQAPPPKQNRQDWDALLREKGVQKPNASFSNTEGVFACCITGRMPDGSSMTAQGQPGATRQIAFESAVAALDHHMRSKRVVDWNSALRRKAGELVNLSIRFVDRPDGTECIVRWGRGDEHCIQSPACGSRLEAFDAAVQVVMDRERFQATVRQLRMQVLDAAGLRHAFSVVESEAHRWRDARKQLVGVEDPEGLQRLHHFSRLLEVAAPATRARLEPADQLAGLRLCIEDIERHYLADAERIKLKLQPHAQDGELLRALLSGAVQATEGAPVSRTPEFLAICEKLDLQPDDVLYSLMAKEYITNGNFAGHVLAQRGAWLVRRGSVPRSSLSDAALEKLRAVRSQVSC